MATQSGQVDVAGQLAILVSANGVEQVEEALNRMKQAGDNAANASQKTAGKMSKLNQAAGQLSFGLQDMLITFQTMGAGGALRAASNNFAQMGAILAPGVTGAIAGLSVTALSLIPDLLNMGKAAKTAASDVKVLTEAIKELIETRKEQVRQGESNRRKDRAEDRRKKFREGKDPVENRENLNARLAEIDKKRSRLKRDYFKSLNDEAAAFEKIGANLTPEQHRAITRNIVGAGRFVGGSAQTFPELVKADKQRLSKQDEMTMKAVRKLLLREAKDVGLTSRDLERHGLGKDIEFLSPKDLATRFGKMLAKEGKLSREFGGPGKIPNVGQVATTEERKRLRDVQRQEGDRRKDIKKEMDDLRDERSRLLKLKPSIESKATQEIKDKKQVEQFVALLKQDADESREIAKEEAAARKQAVKDRRDEIRALKDEGKSLRDIEAILDPTAGKLRKIKDQFMEIDQNIIAGALMNGGAMNPFAFAAQAGPLLAMSERARKKALADAVKTKAAPGISGTFGLTDFSKQLQNALLKSDVQKNIQENTKKTATNTKDVADGIDRVNKKLEDLNMGFGP